LLSSDAIGELYDANWRVKLFNRTQQFGPDMDQSEPVKTYGDHSDENFKNPH
jgi:hypothetical protein